MPHAADSHDLIRVRGARENNLRGVDLDLPKRRLTVFTGVSGSGKSSLVFATIAAVFAVKPDILGDNVAQAAPLVIAVLFVPALRNLIEYQAELLYGRGQTVTRLVLYALVGTLKAALMVLLLSHDWADGQWLVWLNGVFAALYAVSFAVTYRALAQPAIRV